MRPKIRIIPEIEFSFKEILIILIIFVSIVVGTICLTK